MLLIILIILRSGYFLEPRTRNIKEHIIQSGRAHFYLFDDHPTFVQSKGHRPDVRRTVGDPRFLIRISFEEMLLRTLSGVGLPTLS